MLFLTPHQSTIHTTRLGANGKGIVLAYSEEQEAWAVSSEPNGFNNQAEIQKLGAQVKKLERECDQLKRELFMRTTVVS